MPWQRTLQSMGSHWRISREMTSHFYFRVWILAGGLVWSRDQPGSSCSLKLGDEMRHHESCIQVTKKQGWRIRGESETCFRGRDDNFWWSTGWKRWKNKWNDFEMFNLGSMVIGDAINGDRENLGCLVGCIMMGKDKVFIWSKSTCETHSLPPSFPSFLPPFLPSLPSFLPSFMRFKNSSNISCKLCLEFGIHCRIKQTWKLWLGHLLFSGGESYVVPWGNRLGTGEQKNGGRGRTNLVNWEGRL